MNSNLTNKLSSLPAIFQLGKITAMSTEDYGTSEDIVYNDGDQKTIIYNMGGSKKKLTMCAKNVGNILFPKYKNVGDDAEDR
jgi:hypothetical protein